MRPDELNADRNASTRSDPLPAAERLHVLVLPDFDRVDRIGEFYWANPKDADVPSS